MTNFENSLPNIWLGNSELNEGGPFQGHHLVECKSATRAFLVLEDSVHSCITCIGNSFQWEQCNAPFFLWWCCREMLASFPPQIAADRWGSSTRTLCDHFIIKGPFKQKGIIQTVWTMLKSL